MPTYDYECPTCGHFFEVFHGMNERPVKGCPKCRSGKPTRRIVPPEFILRGSGFYANDSKGSASGGVSSKTGKEAKADKGKE